MLGYRIYMYLYPRYTWVFFQRVCLNLYFTCTMGIPILLHVHQHLDFSDLKIFVTLVIYSWFSFQLLFPWCLMELCTSPYTCWPFEFSEILEFFAHLPFGCLPLFMICVSLYVLDPSPLSVISGSDISFVCVTCLYHILNGEFGDWSVLLRTLKFVSLFLYS